MRRLAPLVLITLVGCDPWQPSVRTTEFRTYTVQVVDASGEPVPGLEAQSVVAATGRVLEFAEVNAEVSYEPGIYYVATDGHADAIS